MPSVTEQFQLENLTDDQRLQLIEELWETLTTNKSSLPLADWQKAELDRRMALESEGLEVFEAGTLQRGLIDSATRRPELVVLDLGLPDGDGLDFIREFRGWSSSPILVLSAREGEGTSAAAITVSATSSAAWAARRRISAARPPPSNATTMASIRNSASDDDSRMPRRSRGSALVKLARRACNADVSSGTIRSAGASALTAIGPSAGP